MTETGVPYQAGEPAAEKPLGQVLYEAVYAEQVVRDVQTAGDLVQWGDADMLPEAQATYVAWAAAVEAEVLRRAVAHLDAHDPPDQTMSWFNGYEAARDRLAHYAARSEEARRS